MHFLKSSPIDIVIGFRERGRKKERGEERERKREGEKHRRDIPWGLNLQPGHMP